MSMLPETDASREILALQIEANPNFLAEREVLYAAVVEAQSKIRICPEPEYGILAKALRDANAALSLHGANVVIAYQNGKATQQAEFEFESRRAAEAAKEGRHREVARDSMVRQREKRKGA